MKNHLSSYHEFRVMQKIISEKQLDFLKKLVDVMEKNADTYKEWLNWFPSLTTTEASVVISYLIYKRAAEKVRMDLVDGKWIKW